MHGRRLHLPPAPCLSMASPSQHITTFNPPAQLVRPHLDAGALQLLVHRQARALQAPHHRLALAARLGAAHPRARELDLRQ